MPSVISEIKQWAKQLPFWEQAALDKTLSDHQFIEADYDELLLYLLEDAGLSSKAKSTHPQFSVLNATTDDSEAALGLIRLEKVYNMNNINALVSGQTLTFCPTLTAIFGANGSGKVWISRSGSSRIA